MSTLEHAIALATRKYAGLADDTQRPTIFHPLRLMIQMKSPEQQIVAVLHNILETTDTTVVDLITFGFSEDIIDAILALTKKEHESDIEAAYRALNNPIARMVKLADVASSLAPETDPFTRLHLTDDLLIQQNFLSNARS